MVISKFFLHVPNLLFGTEKTISNENISREIVRKRVEKCTNCKLENQQYEIEEPSKPKKSIKHPKSHKSYKKKKTHKTHKCHHKKSIRGKTFENTHILCEKQ